MRILLGCIALAIAFTQPCSKGFAGFEFQIDAGAVDLGALLPGQVVDAEIYVAATGTDIPLFDQLQGVAFNLIGAGGGTEITGFTKNPAFGAGTSAVPSGMTLNQTPLAGFVAPVAGRVLVGEIEFTAGPGTTVYNFLDPGLPPSADVTGVVDNAFTELDAQVFNSPTVSFTAVPEPGSLGCLIGLGFLAARRRRRA